MTKNALISFMTALLLFGGSAVASKKDAKINSMPDLQFVDVFNGGDTVSLSFVDAAPFIYEGEKWIDFSPATWKFLHDEMLWRYQRMVDDRTARAAINRMDEHRRPISKNPPLMGIMRTANDCYMSERVYQMCLDSLVAFSQSMAEAGKIHKTDYFRVTRWENNMHLREPHYLEPQQKEYLAYINPLKMDKKPVCMTDTMGLVDYNPAEFVVYRYMDCKAAEPWIKADMVAKYRFFAHVLKNADGKLVQTSTADELRLSPQVWAFFTEVLDGLNAPGSRVHYPADSWTDDPAEAERMAREFFLAYNRGHSSKVLKKNGSPKSFYNPSPDRYVDGSYYYRN